MNKKIINIVILAVAIIMAAVVLVMRFVPGKVIKGILPEGNPLESVACLYQVRVSGDSMMPVFSDGSRVSLNKCIRDKENIAIGTIVLYRAFDVMKLGRIRSQVDGPSGKYYKVSPEARPNDTNDVFPDSITATYEMK